MLSFLHREADFLLSWLNSLVTWGVITTLPWDKVLTALFVTLPVGVWSWFRLIDYLKARYSANKPNVPSNDRTEPL